MPIQRTEFPFPSDKIYSQVNSQQIDFSNEDDKLKQIGYDLCPEEYKHQEIEGESSGPMAVNNERTGEECMILEPGTMAICQVEN